ncbi:hypothetical protein [Actinocorallia populi]|uniref:hypothetical protein n=1 Tax=Actinocorallia populi TaxID=2079200 RepID=UPI000D091277|nr:hypothetical protein [Actinocorallia populi]
MFFKRCAAVGALALAGFGITAGTAQALMTYHGDDFTNGSNSSTIIPRDMECDGNGVYSNTHSKNFGWIKEWDGNGSPCNGGDGGNVHLHPAGVYSFNTCEDHVGCSGRAYW